MIPETIAVELAITALVVALYAWALAKRALRKLEYAEKAVSEAAANLEKINAARATSHQRW